MKLSKIIADYLESNKRLVLPQLGAFIVKEAEGRIIFSELLRRDDGVFRSLLMAQGMGEMEAAAAVDRFIFDIRHALQHGTPFILEGLGALLCGPDNTIVFKYAPSRGKSDLEAMAAREIHQESIPEPSVSRSATAQPDRHVKGLRYDTPPKNRIAGYAPAGRRGRKRSVDKFLLLAIAAAVMAVSVMVYGYFVERRKAAFEAELNMTDDVGMVATEGGAELSGEQSGTDGQ